MRSFFPYMLRDKSKLYYDWQSVGQSVLVSGTHLGPTTHFPLLPIIIFTQLLVSCWGAPSLTRGRVCTFPLLPGITSAIFHRSESHVTHEHILLSLFWDSPNLEGPVMQDMLNITTFRSTTGDWYTVKAAKCVLVASSRLINRVSFPEPWGMFPGNCTYITSIITARRVSEERDTAKWRHNARYLPNVASVFMDLTESGRNLEITNCKLIKVCLYWEPGYIV
jgi:hypothetical protein